MVIDYSTPEGKLRMRLGDTSDLPYLSSSVYTAVYEESSENLNRAVIICGQMILAQLSYKTHRKMGLQLEVWGAEAFKNYKEFLILTVSNPAFMPVTLLPYSTTQEFNPIIQFASDWNKNYCNGTESQQLAVNALNSPNDGSLYGPLGGSSTGWQLV